MTVAGEAVHSDPVWRERANFIIATTIDPSGTHVETEQLWARKIDSSHFELCCIPFFAYDLALGDVVETGEDFLVERVTEPSGRYVFRVFFGRPEQPRQGVSAELQSRGALMEWSSAKLLAVDTRDHAHAQEIADFLQERETLGQLMYETGRSV